MTAHKIVVDVPADHKLHLDIDVPSDIPAGEVELSYEFKLSEKAIRRMLAGVVPEELIGSVEIHGDILEPMNDEWECMQ